MSTDKQIRALERELEHASAIAICSIGQADRHEAVAHRERIRAELHKAREAASE